MQNDWVSVLTVSRCSALRDSLASVVSRRAGDGDTRSGVVHKAAGPNVEKTEEVEVRELLSTKLSFDAVERKLVG